MQKSYLHFLVGANPFQVLAPDGLRSIKICSVHAEKFWMKTSSCSEPPLHVNSKHQT